MSAKLQDFLTEKITTLENQYTEISDIIRIKEIELRSERKKRSTIHEELHACKNDLKKLGDIA